MKDEVKMWFLICLAVSVVMATIVLSIVLQESVKGRYALEVARVQHSAPPAGEIVCPDNVLCVDSLATCQRQLVECRASLPRRDPTWDEERMTGR